MVKTTVLIDDDLYVRVVNESIKMFGTARNISQVINKILRERLAPEKQESMFGKLRGDMDLGDLREKHDRFD